MAGSVWVLKPAAMAAKASATPAGITNTEALGRILYTDYVYYFQIAGLVLLVAMIGAIVLTLRSRPGVRRQSIAVAERPHRGDGGGHGRHQAGARGHK